MNVLDQVTGTGFVAYQGDCVEVVAQLPARSVDYSIFSPPFASLYTYSNSPRDMGNCRDDAEFFAHFGHLIRAFQAEGFIYASEVCIWKDPVTAMQRTKALGLLHKTIRNNAAMSRQGIPDYLVTMRAPGEADVDDRIKHGEDLPVSLWQEYASPVWMDINPSDTLQFRSAREHDDERHICPLQLDVIRRGIHLWTNPGDVVLSPFMGIGSEGYVALELGRRFVGVELKASYFQQAGRNLQAALSQAGLFEAA